MDKTMFRIWRYYKAPYDHNPDLDCSNTIETIRDDVIYTDEVLHEIAVNGFNGIWLDAHLHDLVKHPAFPEFGVYADQHIAALRRLIDKASAFGIKVWLCMQPGRGISENDTAFWKNHPEVAGTRNPIETKLWGAKGDKTMTDLISFCTSVPVVKQYLRDAFAELGKALPGLGGCILITRSEFPAHCFTYEQPQERMCPVCAKRGMTDVISEVVTLACNGLHSTAPESEIIAWDWGWLEQAPEIVRRLPKSVILMSNFESGCVRTVCGHENVTINEYSLSSPGPSPWFEKEISYAEEHGLRWMARLQIGTTHELGTVSNLPVLASLFQKADFLRKHDSAGFMGCWNFGNMFSANTAAFNFFLSDCAPDNCHEALCRFAAEYFEHADPEECARAWEFLTDILIQHYPFDNNFMYAGPIGWAAGYVSPPGPMQGEGGLNFSCRLGNERGDNFPAAFLNYSIDEILPDMEKVADGWEKGTIMLDKALSGDPGIHAQEELCAVHAAAASFRSTVNLLKIIQIKMKNGEASGEDYLSIQRDELANAKKLLPCLENDSRQGFHAEARAYFFDQERVRRKIARLEEILNRI